ncbi:MAG: hypothetical protein R2784_02840 [Saprospiraceae bacterium]
MDISRINLWSSPRNISTAMMYSFGNRIDISVVDEPLYAHYLSFQKTETEHPGKDEILLNLSSDYKEVIQKVLLAPYPTPIVLFKQMSHHLIEMDWDFMLSMQNVLLIRNPEEIIHSYSKVIENPTMEDVGIEMQYELYNFLLTNGKEPIIIDTNDVLKNPSKILKLLCTQLGIPFSDSMLTWEKGPRKEDGIWAKYWYENVHNSTGFLPYTPKEIHLNEKLKRLSQTAQPFYDFLYEKAIG